MMAADAVLPARKPAQIPDTHGSLFTTMDLNGVYRGQYCSEPASQGHSAGNQPQPMVSDASLRLAMLSLSTSETTQRQPHLDSPTPFRNRSALSEETLVEMPTPSSTPSWKQDLVSSNGSTPNVTLQVSLAPGGCDIFLSYSSRIEASIPAHLKSQQPKPVGEGTQAVPRNTTLEISAGTRDRAALVRSPNRHSYLECLRAAAISLHQSPKPSPLAQPIHDGIREAGVVGATDGVEGLRDARWQEDGQGRPKTSIHLSAPASALSTNPGKVSTPATLQDSLCNSRIVHKSRRRAGARAVRTLAQSTSALCSEEDGGCGLIAKVDFQGEGISINQNTPREEARNKDLTEAGSKSKVHHDSSPTSLSVANLSVRLTPTKDAKFGNLVRKLLAKSLLDEDTTQEVHIFVDMSNIFIGFQNFSKESRHYRPGFRAPFEPFSFEHFSYILERGRSIGKRHLAGSIRYAKQWNNLPRHFIEARRCGYTTKIFQQVEKPDASYSNSSPNTSSDECDASLDLGTLCPRTKLGEQGVDETLHLAMQDSMLEAAEPGIMVLATGDAKPAEFSAGFAHYATKALERGWHVEIVSWRRCLSSEWGRAPFSDKYASQIRIIEVDDLFDEMRANWVDPSLNTPIAA